MIGQLALKLHAIVIKANRDIQSRIASILAIHIGVWMKINTTSNTHN